MKVTTLQIHVREARAARLQEQAGQRDSPGHTATPPSHEVGPLYQLAAVSILSTAAVAVP